MDDRWIEVDFNQSEKTGKNRLIRISFEIKHPDDFQ